MRRTVRTAFSFARAGGAGVYDGEPVNPSSLALVPFADAVPVFVSSVVTDGAWYSAFGFSLSVSFMFSSVQKCLLFYRLHREGNHPPRLRPFPSDVSIIPYGLRQSMIASAAYS